MPAAIWGLLKQVGVTSLYQNLHLVSSLAPGCVLIYNFPSKDSNIHLTVESNERIKYLKEFCKCKRLHMFISGNMDAVHLNHIILIDKTELRKTPYSITPF